jgi:hypothetical protein
LVPHLLALRGLLGDHWFLAVRWLLCDHGFLAVRGLLCDHGLLVVRKLLDVRGLLLDVLLLCAHWLLAVPWCDHGLLAVRGLLCDHGLLAVRGLHHDVDVLLNLLGVQLGVPLLGRHMTGSPLEEEIHAVPDFQRPRRFHLAATEEHVFEADRDRYIGLNEAQICARAAARLGRTRLRSRQGRVLRDGAGLHGDGMGVSPCADEKAVGKNISRRMYEVAVSGGS